MSEPLFAILEKKARDARAPMEHRQQLAEEEHRQRAALHYQRLTALKNNEDFQWFLSEYLAPYVTRAEEACKDSKRAGLQGPIAAHRYESAHDMLKMLDDRLEEARATVESILQAAK